MAKEFNKQETKNYKIYILYNDTDYDTYIGVTCKTLGDRLSTHRYDSTRRLKNTKICKKIRKLGRDNIKIIELLSANTDWVDAHRTEGELIEFFKPTLNTIATGKFLNDDGSF